MTKQLHLGVALDGYGWNPQAWQATLGSSPDIGSVLSGRYWSDLARTAERGMLDFLSIDDTLMPQPGRRERIDPRRLAGRADAVLVAARIAPAARHIGLIPVATVTHAEPFHVSNSIATLDYISHGRAGWQARISATAHEAALFGRRNGSLKSDELIGEAVEHVEVVRRLWETAEDDEVTRDVAGGHHADRDKPHHIDFAGKSFSVQGPSLKPVAPQGQPVVAALAHSAPIYEFAAACADLVFVTPTDAAALRSILDEVRAAGGAQLKVFADVVVSFGGDGDFRSDAVVFAGTPAELVDMLLEWQLLGIDGARLRPAANFTDLRRIVDEVVPLLQRAGRFRSGYQDAETLRERLGLPVAVNRDTEVRQ